ncbi:MAG TPA: SCO family protein [Gammaproteobacteria bacterium]|nr:SCO family protein [Gammaproteobacteria bacterium]
MKKTIYTVIIAVLLILIFGAMYVFRKEAPVTPDIHGVVLDQPKPLVTIALKDMNGNSFTDQSFLGHWSLVFFGFTTCPDICPTTMSLLNQVMDLVYAKPGVPMPQVVFVSVDPERDTPEKLKQYVTHFNPNFIGVTGNHDQLTDFSRQLGVVYEKVSTDNSADYTIDHGGSIALINRRGAIQAYFTPPLDAQHIADDYATTVGYASPCLPPTN